MTVFDPDQLGSGSYRNLVANTAGPLRSAAIESILPLDATASVSVAWAAREPLVVAVASVAVAQDVVFTAALADHSPASFGSARFVAYTEQGAALPIHQPGVDPAARTAAPFSLAFTAMALKADVRSIAFSARPISRLPSKSAYSRAFSAACSLR